MDGRRPACQDDEAKKRELTCSKAWLSAAVRNLLRCQLFAVAAVPVLSMEAAEVKASDFVEAPTVHLESSKIASKLSL